MVTTLERKGFLVRSVDVSNRRCLEVELTRAGANALAKCNALVDELEAQVFSGVSEAEQARFPTDAPELSAGRHRLGALNPPDQPLRFGAGDDRVRSRGPCRRCGLSSRLFLVVPTRLCYVIDQRWIAAIGYRRKTWPYAADTCAEQGSCMMRGRVVQGHAGKRRSTRRGILGLVVVALATLSPMSAATASGAITLYGATGLTYPHHVVAGPDGNLWFTNDGKDGASLNSGSIGKMTPSGALTLYSCTTPCVGDITNPHGITVGPDGNLWFVNKEGGTGGGSPPGSVGKITTSGVITIYDNATINGPNSIAVGPDGNLWFVNTTASSIGKITTSGVVTNYTDSSINHPKGITAGYDGALWFTNYSGDPNPCSSGNACGIGRITTSGVVSSPYSCTAGTMCTTVNEPTEIVSGPDSGLWFTNDGSKYIGRISTSGAVTTYLDSAIASSYGITVGPDFALWFTDWRSDMIGRIDTSGTISNYACPCSGGNMDVVYAIAAGPDGNLWFTNHVSTGLMGKATTDYSVTITPVAGPAGTSLATTKGAGFSSGDTVVVTFDTHTPPPTQICTATVAPDGTFSCTASIPSSAGPVGTHTVKAKGLTTTAKTTFLLTS